VIEGSAVGIVGRLHAEVEKAFDLPRTYVCELDFSALRYDTITAKGFAKFPALTRDLSLMVPKERSFADIRQKLQGDIAEEIRDFYPIDLYESEEMGDNRSVTVRFEIRSDEKTLTEEEINAMMDQVLVLLDEMGIKLR
jgi:phenylalanyl-tRNA synthetase beta chain